MSTALCYTNSIAAAPCKLHMYLNMVSSYVIVMHLIFGVPCSLYRNMGTHGRNGMHMGWPYIVAHAVKHSNCVIARDKEAET